MAEATASAHARSDGRRAVSTRAAVGLATLAYVLGWTAHVTFIFYLAPLALRVAGAQAYDGWVFAGTAIASVIAVFPAGRLADEWPRRRVLRLGLALLAATYVPILAPPTLAGVLIATALTGTGLALLLVSFNAYLADLLATRGMSAAYGRTTALAILAGAIGPFVAAALFGLSDDAPRAIRFNAALFGSGAVLATLLTLALPTAAREATATAPRVREGGAGLRDAWREERATVRPATLVYLAAGAGAGMTSPYFAVYFLDVVQVAPATWGVLLGFATATSALGSMLVGMLGRHVSHERLLVLPQAGLVLASLPFLAPLATLALGVAYISRSLFQFTVSPTLNALMMSRVAPTARGRTQAWANLAWNLGWAAGAGAGGVLLARMGGALFPFGSAISLAGVALGVAMFARHPRAQPS